MKEVKEKGNTMPRDAKKDQCLLIALGVATCGLCTSPTPINSPSLHLQDPWQQLALLVGVGEPKARREPKQLLTPVLRLEVEHPTCLPKDQGRCLFHLPARMEDLITVPSSPGLTR